MVDIDYSNPEYLEVWQNTVWYKDELVFQGDDMDGRFIRPSRASTFLDHHFSDTYSPTQNEIVLFELIFGEGTVKKIYDKILGEI